MWGSNSNNSKIIVDLGEAAAKASFFNGFMNTALLEFDPLISGFSFVKWTVIPKWVIDKFKNFREMTEKNFKSFGGISDIELESQTMTHGFNANEYNYASGTKKGNSEFTMKHQEFSGSPIRNMYQYWISGIRDPETGIATYARAANTDYAAKNHTGELCYIVTRPDANNVDKNNIEFACYYTAVFPTRILLSQFNFDNGTHDGFEYEQTFKGVFHASQKIDQYASQILKEKTYGIAEMAYFDPAFSLTGTDAESGVFNNMEESVPNNDQIIGYTVTRDQRENIQVDLNDVAASNGAANEGSTAKKPSSGILGQ